MGGEQIFLIGAFFRPKNHDMVSILLSGYRVLYNDSIYRGKSKAT